MIEYADDGVEAHTGVWVKYGILLRDAEFSLIEYSAWDSYELVSYGSAWKPSVDGSLMPAES